MKLFFIPILYTYSTRLQTPMKALSLIIIYVIPVLSLVIIANNAINISLLITALLAITALYNIYELGYIQNDAETIKKEKKPNLRLSPEQLNFYEKNKKHIYVTRFIIEILLLVSLYMLSSSKGIICFSCSLLAMMIVFRLYNTFRSHVNMLLYFILVTFRYCSPLALFPDNFHWTLVLIAIFTFPLVKTIEFKSAKGPENTTNIWFRKYILHFDKNRLTAYRVIAYLIITIIAVFLFYTHIFKSWTYLIPIVWMLLYRTSILVSIKLGAKYKNYLKN